MNKIPAQWSEPIAAWVAEQARHGLSRRTIDARRVAVVKFARTQPEPFSVTVSEAADFLESTSLYEGTAPRLMRAGLRAFYAWATDAGHVPLNPIAERGRIRTGLPEAWAAAITQWRVFLERDGKAGTTIEKACQHLALYATTDAPRDPWAVTPGALADWFRAQPWAPSTAAKVRADLRAFYAWAAECRLVPSSPAECLTAIGLPGTLRPLGSYGPLPHRLPISWQEPVVLFSRHLRAEGRSPSTVELRELHLRRIARDLEPLEPWSVTTADLVSWLAGQKVQPATRATYRASMRAFYSWATEAGYLDADPSARVPRIRSVDPSPHPASETAVQFAVVAADRRERLMVRLAAELGLRRAEVSAVHTRDLIEGDDGWWLRVMGKGQRVRVMPLPASLASELRDLAPGWVFPSVRGDHLSPAYVGKRIGQLLPEGFGAHSLRHRFATRAYALESDLLTVQRLLGHARPETTQRYVASPQATLRSTIDRMSTVSTDVF